MADSTEGIDIPAEDEAVWVDLRSEKGRDALMDDPEFYICEGNTLAVGRAPDSTSDTATSQSK